MYRHKKKIKKHIPGFAQSLKFDFFFIKMLPRFDTDYIQYQQSVKKIKKYDYLQKKIGQHTLYVKI